MKRDRSTARFRIDKPERFRLSDHDPGECDGLAAGKSDAKRLLADDVERLRDLQERFYADGRWSALIVLQGMDAAGKDGIIEHVMSGLNPQGVEVHPFKQPSEEELRHDFLWRISQRLPAKGRIGIFNRSHYEDVVTVRVHEALLLREHPPHPPGNDVWEQRFEGIRAFEQHLARSGTVIVKFFLNLSKAEQRERFLARIQEPAKRWKFSMGDVAERKLWPKYMAAYEEAIRATSRSHAPWYVVPADHKWFARLLVAKVLVEELTRLGLVYPKVTGKALEDLLKAEKALKADK